MNTPVKSLNLSTCSHKKVRLGPGELVNSNVTGRFLIVIEATLSFTLRVGGGEEMPWNLGLSYTCEPGDFFTSLTFRNPSATETIEIEYLFGVGLVEDKRLNIVRDRPGQLWLQAAPTLLRSYALTSLAGSATQELPGQGDVGSGYAHRKSVVVTNNDPALDLEVTDGTNTIAIVFARQAWYLETSADLVVLNPNVSAVNCRIVEVFYPET